jgi:hypothetical protein
MGGRAYSRERTGRILLSGRHSNIGRSRAYLIHGKRQRIKHVVIDPKQLKTVPMPAAAYIC